MTSKPLPITQFAKLEKMMGLTFSDNDPEALVALRMANKILTAHKLTWSDVFKRLVTVDVESAPDEPTVKAEGHGGSGQPSAKSQGSDIAEAFEIVRRDLKKGTSFADFIDSLEVQWDEKGYLSPAQRKALFDAATRAVQHATRRR